MKTIRIMVEVDVERDEGKFAGRDEIIEQIIDAIDGSNPGSIDGVGADGSSVYLVTEWSVNEA